MVHLWVWFYSDGYADENRGTHDHNEIIREKNNNEDFLNRKMCSKNRINEVVSKFYRF
jgi:hypothetical protein